MKLLLVNTLYHPNFVGGADLVTQAIAEGLVGAGHEVSVASVAPEPGARQAVVNGVTVHYLGLRNLYWPFRAEGRPGFRKPLWHAVDTDNRAMAGALGRVLDAERPDVVHTHNLMGFSSGAWPAAAARAVPVVHTIHDYYLLCPRSTMFRDGENCARQHLDCALYARLRVRRSARVRAVVGVSRFVLERHLALGAFRGVAARHVIHNPYEPRSAPGVRGPGARAPGPLRIGYIGRLDPTKGIERLLETVTSHLPAGTCEVVVAGTGAADYEAALRARFGGPGVRFLGFARPEAFFPAVDVLVVPSLWHEPLGMVVVEAWAHGVPVIGARRGGISELLDDPRTGTLFEPDDPASLVAALAPYLADPASAAAAGPRCAERAAAFSTRAVVARYAAVYAEAAAARGTGRGRAP